MFNEIVTLVKLDTVHLYLDLKKKIIYFDVTNSSYSKQNSITVLQYFKNFWILAKEQNAKYYLVIKINSIGIYPLSFYNNLVDCLTELNYIFKEHLHSCSFLCSDSNPLTMLKPLFNIYNFVRPYTVCNTYEEVIIYFKKTENQVI
uniref:CRAL-TRIO domain-containing protein n=1 Tax=viral metagenome TaxID=1070528 RepID=A0A6C0LDC9_9ZZZZ